MKTRIIVLVSKRADLLEKQHELLNNFKYQINQINYVKI